MYTYTISKKEMNAIEAKGYKAVKNPIYIVNGKICRMNAWLVFVEGKGFVKHGYGTKSVALTSAEYDATHTKDGEWGRYIMEEDLAKYEKDTFAYSVVEGYMKQCHP